MSEAFPPKNPPAVPLPFPPKLTNAPVSYIFDSKLKENPLMTQQQSARETLIEARMGKVEAILEELSESHLRLDRKLDRLSDEVDQVMKAVRLTNEAVKQTNETVRQTNETVRQTNEAVRQTNETVRQTNDSIRFLAFLMRPKDADNDLGEAHDTSSN